MHISFRKALVVVVAVSAVLCATSTAHGCLVGFAGVTLNNAGDTGVQCGRAACHRDGALAPGAAAATRLLALRWLGAPRSPMCGPAWRIARFVLACT